MKAYLPILPTSVVRSHAKMGWSYLARQEAEAGSMGQIVRRHLGHGH
jgi:hypothetical protein